MDREIEIMVEESTKRTVFYSWQSDLPNSTNRGFIQTALERAIEGILDTELDLDVCLDRDTQDIEGSPNIVQIILSKIGQCAVFVADVSIINASDQGGRLTPNPNVLFELGYALHALSWSNILLIFNEETGRIED